MRADTNVTFMRDIRVKFGEVTRIQEHLFPSTSIRIVDYFCNAFFTIEFIVHFAVCPDSKFFFKSFMNLIDLLALIPFYINIALLRVIEDAIVTDSSQTATTATISTQYSIPDSLLTFSEVIRFFRLVRLFRIIKLSKHLTGLKILYHTLRSSWKELLLLVIFVSIQVLFFSTIIYYTEKGVIGNKFYSIPEGFWWAIATMTTVGYGDIVPKTTMGKVVGSVCAIFGVLTIALPVPVIVNNFSLYYNHAQAQAKLPKKKKIKTYDAALTNDPERADWGSLGGDRTNCTDTQQSNGNKASGHPRSGTKRVSPVHGRDRRHDSRGNKKKVSRDNAAASRVVEPPITLQAYIDRLNASHDDRRESLSTITTVRSIVDVTADDMYESEILPPIPENTTEINGTLPLPSCSTAEA